MPCGSRGSLVGALNPFDRQVLALEEMGGPIEILVTEDLEAEIAGFSLVGFLQDDAVVAALLHGAQINRVRVFVGDLQAECVDIEGPGFGEIDDAEFDMAETHDVEGRVKIWVGYRHRVLLRSALLGGQIQNCFEISRPVSGWRAAWSRRRCSSSPCRSRKTSLPRRGRCRSS